MITIDIHKKLRAGKGQTDLQIRLQAHKGTVTVIQGPSGAGKSTFLKIIAGLADADNGSINIHGTTWLDTAKGINLSPQKRKAGFVFQNYALFPNMTVREHLEYAGADAAWIDQLLTLGGLQGDADHQPEQLSGGQQQRLAILRAMANKPALLLMDEPFSALDQKTKADLIAGLQKLWGEMETTVIIVSHYPQELAEIAGQDVYIGD